MIILSADEKRFVEVGSADLWYSIISTAEIRLKNLKKMKLALDFLYNGKCSAKENLETARQINLLRDAFSMIPPKEVVYNKDNINLIAPWYGNISPIVTSCGNLYTTADGKDLLFEVVSILTYAHYKKVDILSAGWSER